MNNFKQGFMRGFILGMAFIAVLLFLSSSAIAQQQQTQLQQAMAEIARLNIVIEDVKTERNALIIRASELTKNAIAINDGILKATQKLQKGYNDGKLNYEELRLMGFNIVVDSSSVFKKPNNKGDSQK